jgi:hypothetical protein
MKSEFLVSLLLGVMVVGCTKAVSVEPQPSGPTGAVGAPGTSCNPVPVSGGVDIVCGDDAPIFLSNGANGSNGTNCSASIVSGGANINCGSNSPIFLANGSNGTNGTNGATGQKGATGATGSNGSNGLNGSTGATGATGANGLNGANGATGQNGTNGTNCSAISVSGGVNLVCGSNAPVFVASSVSQIDPGIMCTAYSILTKDYSTSPGSVNWAQMLNDGTEQFSTMLSNFNVANQSDTVLFPGFTNAEQALVGQTNWALDCYGFLNVPETGGYTFQLSSDDGSQLVINNTVIINMSQAQAYASTTSSEVTLFAGPQQINLLYFQGPQTNVGLTLKWQGPTSAGLSTLSVIPASAFTYQVE